MVSILATSACTPLLGLEIKIGVVVAIMAMGGDLFSSFVKRRCSSQFIGLDQIPESLIPSIASRQALSLTYLDIIAGTILFFFGEILLSQLLFKLRIRDHELLKIGKDFTPVGISHYVANDRRLTSVVGARTCEHGLARKSEVADAIPSRGGVFGTPAKPCQFGNIQKLLRRTIGSGISNASPPG